MKTKNMDIEPRKVVNLHKNSNINIVLIKNNSVFIYKQALSFHPILAFAYY